MNNNENWQITKTEPNEVNAIKKIIDYERNIENTLESINTQLSIMSMIFIGLLLIIGAIYILLKWG